MDTSPEYIEMCSKADDIQEIVDRKGVHAGDFWTYENQKASGKIINARKDVYAGTTYNSQLYPAGHGIFHGVGMMYLTIKKEWCGKEHIWLPRQDQLQEMIMNNTKESAEVTFKKFSYVFHEISSGYGYDKERFSIASFEMFWLRYFMKVVYKKIWNIETKMWEVIN